MRKSMKFQSATVFAVAAVSAGMLAGIAPDALASTSTTSTQTDQQEPHVKAVTSKLHGGEYLGLGDSLKSPDGQTTLTLKPGRLTLTNQGRTIDELEFGSSHVSALTLAKDGNLMALAGQVVIWSSDTDGSTARDGQAVSLTVSNHRKAQLIGERTGTTFWDVTLGKVFDHRTLSTGQELHKGQAVVSRNGKSRLEISNDGVARFIVNNAVVWGKESHPVRKISMDHFPTPGNLVVGYNMDPRLGPAWAITNGQAGHENNSRVQFTETGSIEIVGVITGNVYWRDGKRVPIIIGSK